MYSVLLSYVLCIEGISDAAAVTADAAKDEAQQGPNPFVLWIEFIRSSVLNINEFYKGELCCPKYLLCRPTYIHTQIHACWHRHNIL